LDSRLVPVRPSSRSTDVRFAGSTLATAPLGATGAFTSVQTLAAPAGLMEAVYYGGTNLAYIVDGINAPQVWSGSGSTRPLGLSSPTVAPTVTILGNAATNYPLGTTFAYCYTEYDSVNIVESGPSPVAQNQTTVLGDTEKVVLAATVNAGANKYRLYRTQTGGTVFFRLAEFATSITQYYDGSNTEGAAANRTDNTAQWGFKTVDDQFLSTQPPMPMLGAPLQGNYITTNSRPPVGNIAVIFESSLCISGIPSFPQDIYYSLPDSPEQFSPIYFLREENNRGDPVTGVGVANDRLIAFTLNSIYRHDTLPRITDPGFGAGFASRQLVTADHGCVAKRTVVNVGASTYSNQLFYLSNRGPFMTDGYNSVPLMQELTWESRLVNFAAISGAVAAVYPKLFQIRLFVPSAYSKTNDMAFIYHYHRNHLDPETGLGKWTGPVHVRCAAAATAYTRNAEPQLFVADSDKSGDVYLEDNGLVDGQNYEDSSGSINWEWQTGDYDFGSYSNNKRFRRVFLNYVGTDSFQPSLYRAVNLNDKEQQVNLAPETTTAAGSVTYGTSSVNAIKGQRARGGVWATGTHLRLRMQETAAGRAREVSKVELELDDYGVQV